MLGGWTEFGAELAEIDRHAATEQDSRRPGSGRADHPPRYPPDNVPELGAIAGRYGHDPQAPAARPRTALELQAHVSIILEIFPRRESMPAALADDLALMLNERLAVEFESVERIVEAIAGPGGLNERAALAVAAQDRDVLAALEDAKRHAAETVAAMRERVVLLERAEVVHPQPDHWSRMRMWTSRLARPPPLQETVESELDLRPNRGAASVAAYRELRLDARLLRAESALATASEKLASASPLLRADIRAAPVGAEQGRAVISSTAPARDARSLAQLIERPYPRASTRYPAGLEEWEGFRDADKPYDFRTDVVDFQNLRGVGGGIHFGSHAEPDPGARGRLQDGAHLHYDADTRHLTLMLLSGESFTYGLVEPRVLKSLYSYVRSYPGINLAITIGAAGDDDYVRQDNQRPVLLDPAFVDTPVGQWLYLADTLPWQLDKPALPNGGANPVQERFALALAARQDRRGSALSHLTGDTSRVGTLSGLQLEELIPGDNPLRAMILAAAGARTESGFIARYRNVRRPELIDELADSEDVQRLVGIFRSLSADGYTESDVAEAITLHALRGDRRLSWNRGRRSQRLAAAFEPPTLRQALRYMRASSLEKATVFVDAQLDEEVERMRAWYSEYSSASMRVLDLVGSLVQRHDTHDEVPDSAIGLAASAYKTLQPNLSAEELSTRVLDLFDSGTLAVLFDESVRFGLDGGQVRLDTHMRYRYAEPDFEVGDGNLVLHRDVADPMKPPRVRHIEGLGEIATEGFEEIAAAFEPLAKVDEYAGLAAFLRWAACTPESVELCMTRSSLSIDLSALGAFDLRDRTETPTPDAEMSRTLLN